MIYCQLVKVTKGPGTVFHFHRKVKSSCKCLSKVALIFDHISFCDVRDFKVFGFSKNTKI